MRVVRSKRKADGRMRIYSAWIALVFFGIASAQTKQRSATVFSGDKVIAQVADGGGWKTTFYITSMDTATSTFTLRFYGDDGRPLAVPIVGKATAAFYDGTITPKAVTVIETAASGALRFGWALLETTGYLGIQAVFRQSGGAVRPDFEAVVVGDEGFDDKSVLLFDNQGFTTSMAVVNPFSFSRATVTVAIFNAGGERILLDQFTMEPMTHSAFAIPDRWPVTANQRGSIEFTTTSIGLSILGLRFNGAGSFTSVPVMDSFKRP